MCVCRKELRPLKPFDHLASQNLSSIGDQLSDPTTCWIATVLGDAAGDSGAGFIKIARFVRAGA